MELRFMEWCSLQKRVSAFYAPYTRGKYRFVTNIALKDLIASVAEEKVPEKEAIDRVTGRRSLKPSIDAP